MIVKIFTVMLIIIKQSNHLSALNVSDNLNWKCIQSTEDNNTFTVQIENNNLSVTNIYKPLNTGWTFPTGFNVQHPSVVMGDFNSHHTLRGYNDSDKNGEDLIQ